MEIYKTNKRMPAATITDPKILGPVILGAFKKLNPALMIRNPVMFVVEVVAMLTTVLFIRDLVTGGEGLGFSFQINLWLWFTVLFANFAEAVAEGRVVTRHTTSAVTGLQLSVATLIKLADGRVLETSLENGAAKEVAAAAIERRDTHYLPYRRPRACRQLNRVCRATPHRKSCSTEAAVVSRGIPKSLFL